MSRWKIAGTKEGRKAEGIQDGDETLLLKTVCTETGKARTKFFITC